MKALFIILLLTNAGYFAWQAYARPPEPAPTNAPLTVDAQTPPLKLLRELQSQPPPTSSLLPREPTLQEFPVSDTTTAAAP